MPERVDWRSATAANRLAARLAAVPPRTRATVAGYGLAFTAGCALTALVILGAVNVLAAPAPIPSNPEPIQPAAPVVAASVPTAVVVETACDLPVWLPSSVSRWRDGICTAARAHGIDPALLAIVVTIESGGGPNAHSGSGARGLTQVMPATGAGIAAERGIADWTPDALWAPSIALDFGAYYLAQQLGTFGVADDPDWATSVRRACAAFNGGPGTAQRWIAGGALPAETARYVQWCGMWDDRHAATSATFDAWMAAGGRVLVEAAR